MLMKGVPGLQAFGLQVVTVILALMARISDYILYPLASGLRYILWTQSPLPPIEDTVLLMSASEIAEKIRTKQLTSERVVTTFAKRLRKINPILNAVTDERYQDAISDARRVDALINECQGDSKRLEELKRAKPFLGVPVTTKNALAVQGLGHESGLYLRRGMKATEDSAVMAAVRATGAIPLAVTNTPELCLWLESSNRIFGTTRNPYDTRRTCGGSSGGEGAILAACGSPIGVGTDIAGSIRIPAFYNGLFGLKPTIRTVDMTGHYPTAKDLLEPLLTAGPMCKFACDLRPMLTHIVGPRNAQLMALDTRPDLSRLKVYFMEDAECSLAPAPTDELRECTRRVAGYLAKLSQSSAQPLPSQGAIREGMASATQIYIAYLTKADIPSFAQELTMLKGEISPSREMLKWTLGWSKHTFPALLVANLERVNIGYEDAPITNYFYNLSKKVEKELELLLEDGVLVIPTLPDVAPFHNLTAIRLGMIGLTGLWNILGFPAVNVPLGLNLRGMPLGVTVIAGKMKDNVCCEVALELERKFHGWTAPCPIASQK